MRRALMALLAPAALFAAPAGAADPQSYAVTLQPTGEPALDAALSDTSSLVALRDKAPVGPFALVTRARDDAARLQAALGSYGYYAGTVTIRIAGQDIADPALPATLEAATAAVPIAITVDRGPPFLLRRVALTGPGADLPQARAALQLAPGQPARAAEIVAAAARILEALRNDGHALAKVSDPAATLDPAAHALDIAYQVDAGPQLDLGPITVAGLDRVNESFVRRRLLIHPGERFDPRKIEAARQDLATLGVFATVRAQADPTTDPSGRIPIAIDLTERPRHVVGVTAAYSTDLGPSAGITWSHRNLFGNAERLDLAASFGAGGTATRRPGYNATATFTKPDLLVRDQTLTVTLQGIKESLDAYDRKAALAGVQLSRKLSLAWTLTAGLQAQQSRITQEGDTRDYTLIGLPLGARYDSTGAEGLFEPTHGIKASLTTTPTAALNRGGSDFLVVLATASTYVNFGPPGRSVLALRATIGSIQGATTFQVPPDQRFFAGGSATIRGYKYQSVGPRFADRRPIGGTALATATIEYRQRFGESLGAVLFVDAGQVDTASTPFSANGGIRAGAGIGARYYTPIGPIRLDIAVPLNKQKGDDAFELYIGIGQAF